jgi:acetyl-CoA C-acetyltransferase
MHDMDLNGKVAIVGAYESPRRKADGVHPFEIHAEVTRGVLEDAGVELGDVDGYCTAAGEAGEGGGVENVIELTEYLGLEATYFNGTDVGGCSYIVHAGQAMAAIASGLAEMVLITYASCPRWWPLSTPDWDVPTFPIGPGQWEYPFGPTIPADFALAARRHMELYGTTSEQLAQIAVTCRANAKDNEHARYRESITIDDVLESPTIASPLHKLDCCVVSDSGGAILLASAERAKDCAKDPVWMLGFGAAINNFHVNQWRDATLTPAALSGPRAFAMAGVSHGNIDVAQLYDAFTITPLLALEDLGFCAKGDGGPFVEAGNINPDGKLPINTDGGGLSSNHPGKRGMFAMIEGVRQLRGEGPGVQIEGAKTALVHGWGGQLSAAATLILGV